MKLTTKIAGMQGEYELDVEVVGIGDSIALGFDGVEGPRVVLYDLESGHSLPLNYWGPLTSRQLDDVRKAVADWNWTHPITLRLSPEWRDLCTRVEYALCKSPKHAHADAVTTLRETRHQIELEFKRVTLHLSQLKSDILERGICPPDDAGVAPNADEPAWIP